MKRSGALLLTLLIACSGSADTTTTVPASSTSSSSTSSSSTTTTVSIADLAVTGEVSCETDDTGQRNDITVTVTGEATARIDGVIVWGTGGAELFDGVVANAPLVFSFSKEGTGPGRVVVSDNFGGSIEVPIRAGVCETVRAVTVLEIDAVSYCFEGGEPIVEYTVSATPGIGRGADVTVFVTAIDGQLIYAETFDGPVAEGSGSIGLGDRTGRITVNATTSAGEASPISFLDIPVCVQAPLRIVTAEASCLSTTEWEFTLEVAGEPGVLASYFYAWDGSDAEGGDFAIGKDGTWSNNFPWPGEVQGEVSVASYEGDGVGPVDVDVTACDR